MFLVFSSISSAVIIVLRGMYLYLSMIVSLGIPRSGIVGSKGIYSISRLAF